MSILVDCEHHKNIFVCVFVVEWILTDCDGNTCHTESHLNRFYSKEYHSFYCYFNVQRFKLSNHFSFHSLHEWLNECRSFWCKPGAGGHVRDTYTTCANISSYFVCFSPDLSFSLSVAKVEQSQAFDSHDATLTVTQCHSSTVLNGVRQMWCGMTHSIAQSVRMCWKVDKPRFMRWPGCHNVLWVWIPNTIEPSTCAYLY